MNGWYSYRIIGSLYRPRLCAWKQLDTLMRAKLLEVEPLYKGVTPTPYGDLCFPEWKTTSQAVLSILTGAVSGRLHIISRKKSQVV
jgi:hypothetical protein